jgi:hypothetical protein
MTTLYKEVKGVMPSVKPRTNLATVTMPVRLASAKEIERVGEGGDLSPFNVPANPDVEVPQFSILLTRKGPSMPKLRNGAKLPVFAQLNKIKAIGVHPSFKSKRRALLNQLKFAGIAFTHAKRVDDVGDSNLMAAVIGGSHTVMSYRSDHSDDPLRPGTTVRWTLPGEGFQGDSLNTVPVQYQGTGHDILAELEPVDPSKCLEEVITEVFCLQESKAGHAIPEDAAIAAHVRNVLADANRRALFDHIIEACDNLRAREIGTVISDNGRGSIDIRLK